MIDTLSQEPSTRPGSTVRQIGPHRADPWSDECDCLHPEAVIHARARLDSAPSPDAIATVFSVLGDATRLTVVLALQAGELCVTDLAAATGVNRTTISHQLRVLRAHRLVRRRREGKVVYYALDDDHVSELMSLAIVHIAEDTRLVLSDTPSAPTPERTTA